MDDLILLYFSGVVALHSVCDPIIAASTNVHVLLYLIAAVIHSLCCHCIVFSFVVGRHIHTTC